MDVLNILTTTGASFSSGGSHPFTIALTTVTPNIVAAGFSKGGLPLGVFSGREVRWWLARTIGHD
jgi:hypothetical protein